MNFNPTVATMPQAPMMGMQGAPQMGMMGAPQMNGMQMMQPQMMQSQLPMGRAQGPAGAMPITVAPQQREGSSAMVPGMDPATSASLGVAGLKPPSTPATLLKNMASFGAIGAVLGAAASFILPGGLVIGAAIGGALGAGIGLIRGISRSKAEREQFQTMMMQAGPAALDPQSQVPNNPMLNGKSRRTKSRKARTSKQQTNYTVKSGDTLSSIAARHKTTWKKVYEANRKVVGENPARIVVGAKIEIPGAHKITDAPAKKKTRKKD